MIVHNYKDNTIDYEGNTNYNCHDLPVKLYVNAPMVV